MISKGDLLGLPEPELARAVLDVTKEPYRASQLMAWIYDRLVFSFRDMSNLGKPLRDALEERFLVGVPEVKERSLAEDGAEKVLFSLRDGASIEAVHIPVGDRTTICLSSQAGCAVDCAFCVTGRMGAGRNLTAGEIVGQYLAIARDHGIPPHHANLVFMGMGEPLLNVPNLMTALDLFERLISPKKMTVSTSGILPGIAALAKRERRPNLAVSLSAPDDATRTRLMPINRTYPIRDLFEALREWPLERGRRITFEYVMIAGVNDSPAMARDLARLVARVPSKVNLIPLNESKEYLPGLARPAESVVDAFARTLSGLGVATTVRWSKGLGANAACGQLKGAGRTPRRTRRELPTGTPRA